MSKENRALLSLDRHEGVESFNLGVYGRGALQRLRRKGLAKAVRCPDGAWVWYRTDEGEELAAALDDHGTPAKPA